MRLFVMALALMACHHEIKQQVQLDESEHKAVDAAVEANKSEHREQAATDIETKTETKDNGVVTQAPDGTIQVAKVSADKALTLPKGSKVIGTVPLSSVSTNKSEHIGPVVDDKNSNIKTDTKTDDDKKKKLKGSSDEVTDSGPGWKLYLTIALIVALVLGAVLTVLKFKLWRLL